jgi:hypothetical protein
MSDGYGGQERRRYDAGILHTEIVGLKEVFTIQLGGIVKVVDTQFASISESISGVKLAIEEQKKLTHDWLKDHEKRIIFLEKTPGRNATKILAIISTVIGGPSLIGLIILLVTHGLMK